MNVERLEALAAALDAMDGKVPDGDRPGFDMCVLGDAIPTNDYAGHPCKTAACIAGQAVYQFNGIEAFLDCCHKASHDLVAVELLDLEEEASYPLFYPSVDASWTSITPKYAARAVRNVIKHGEPRWKEVVGK